MDDSNTVDEDYLPFARSDVYGALGVGPLPLWERLRLWVFGIVLVPLKLIGTVGCLLSYYLVIKASIFLPASIRSDFNASLGKIHCRACLFCLGFVRLKWITVGDPAGTAQAEAAPAVGIVSNHCSWTDILLHMSRFFPSFVARDKTKSMPIIGAVSDAMGCIYVDRARRIKSTLELSSPTSKTALNGADTTSQAGVAALVRRRMEDSAAGRLPGSRPMLLFPEGTTTNGKYLLPFKTGAFLAGLPVKPAILRYETRHMSPAWESIPALRHIILMLCNPVHSVTCYELPVYVPSEDERKDPRLYADNVRKHMLEFSGLDASNLTFEDKIQYHLLLKEQHGLLKANGSPRESIVKPCVEHKQE